MYLLPSKIAQSQIQIHLICPVWKEKQWKAPDTSSITSPLLTFRLATQWWDESGQYKKCQDDNNTCPLVGGGVTFCVTTRGCSSFYFFYFFLLENLCSSSTRRELEQEREKGERLRLANRQESGAILKNDCQTHIHYSAGQSGRAQSPYLYRLCKSDLSSLITLKNLPLAHRQYWANITLYGG